MDQEFKTTFIPKKNPSGSSLSTVNASSSSRRTRSLLSLLAILLLITAVVSVAGVFLYKLRLGALVNSRVESINRAEKAFEPTAILELKKLDIRLRAATELLNQHVALSDFFDSFGESTLPDVQFAGMNIDFSESSPLVSLSGEARGYLPIAQQSDIFEKNRYIQNPIFSEFTRTDTGRVSFSLSFSISPELLVYGRTLRNVDIDDISDDQLSNLEDRIIEDQSQVLPAGIPVEFN